MTFDEAMVHSAKHETEVHCDWELEIAGQILTISHGMLCVLNVEGWPIWELASQGFAINAAQQPRAMLLYIQKVAHFVAYPTIELARNPISVSELDNFVAKILEHFPETKGEEA